jgi:sterol desaturase/sphingolipid hydroxylase (fatty acid hydroxylase superfamily)
MDGSLWDYFLNQQKYYRQDFIESLTNPGIKNNYVWIFLSIILMYFCLEYFWAWRKNQKRFREGFWTDLFYTVFNLFIFWWFLGYAVNDLVSKTFNQFLYNSFGIQNLVMIKINQAPQWFQLCFLFIAIDFLMYWIHRLTHNVGFLWQLHKVHHSSKELDIANAMRSHFLDLMLYPLLSYIPMGMIGYTVREFYLIYLIGNIFSMGSHANLPWGFGSLKYLFVSPKWHLWHHVKTVPEGRTSINFGNALSIWDYLFNTAYYKNDIPEKPELGFDDIETYPQNVLGHWTAPFKRWFGLDIKKPKVNS